LYEAIYKTITNIDCGLFQDVNSRYPANFIKMAEEKKDIAEPQSDNPFAKLDARLASTATAFTDAAAITTLKDADEALDFLENHPRPAEIAAEGNAILEDPVQLKKLIRKIDWTIAPLLASVYFLQFLDKTTLSYAAVMGIRTDTHLVGQDYSNVSMLFYIGALARTCSSRVYRADCISLD
jgi:hypothetical protein